MRIPAQAREITVWPARDGYALHVRIWRPAQPANETVLYLHGIQSHGRWFEASAAQLCAAGKTVILPDRRGSGLNAEPRGDVRDADQWFEDLDDLVAAAASCNTAAATYGSAGPLLAPDQPLAVVGVSWGGKLALLWALRRPELVRRLLLIAPGLAPAVDVGLLTRLRIGRSLLTCPSRLFPIPLNDPALFTDNPAGRAFIRDDPLKLTHATARFLYHSSRLDRALRRTPPGSVQAATTLLLAGRERIIRNEPTRALAQRLCAQPLVVREDPAAAHTLEFEADPTWLTGALAAWASAD